MIATYSLLSSYPFSNGVLQPFRQLGWWQWMYYVSPYTYLIEGMLGQGTRYCCRHPSHNILNLFSLAAVGRMEINCSETELVRLNPPSGQSCGSFLQTFIDSRGGYLTDPDATSNCEYCSVRTTDQFLVPNFNIQYENRWRDVGIVLVFVVFNVSH